MRIDFPKWVDRFRDQWENRPIEYLDNSGEWCEDEDPHFSSISNAIQSRGRISVEELRRISRWKLQGGRNDANIEQNDSADVEHQTRAAFQAAADVEAVNILTELSGVGVPLASTVLTVAYPDTYAIIDYRAFRGLAAAKPEIVDPRTNGYGAYAEFLECFRNYLTKADAYEYYMTHVRKIAEEEELSTREIDMALWAFDKEMA
jgi:hypothetical protein